MERSEINFTFHTAHRYMDFYNLVGRFSAVSFRSIQTFLEFLAAVIIHLHWVDESVPGEWPIYEAGVGDP